jgi:hypothetical protein
LECCRWEEGCSGFSAGGLLTKKLKPLVGVILAKISPDFLSVDDPSKKVSSRDQTKIKERR